MTNIVFKPGTLMKLRPNMGGEFSVWDKDRIFSSTQEAVVSNHEVFMFLYAHSIKNQNLKNNENVYVCLCGTQMVPFFYSEIVEVKSGV